MMWVILIAIAALAVFGLTLVHEVPHTPDDALACCAAGSSDLVWTCPAEDGTKECHLHLEIPRAEFENSMHQNVFRTGTVFSPSPVSFVSPSDHYVVTIARHIDAEYTVMEDSDDSENGYDNRGGTGGPGAPTG